MVPAGSGSYLDISVAIEKNILSNRYGIYYNKFYKIWNFFLKFF